MTNAMPLCGIQQAAALAPQLVCLRAELAPH